MNRILMEGIHFPRLPASVDLPARLWLFQYLVSRQLQLVVCNGKHRGMDSITDDLITDDLN